MDEYEELIMRYGLERILEDNDLEAAAVLRILEEEGMLDIAKMLEEMEDGEDNLDD